MIGRGPNSFWKDALALQGSALPLVLPRVLGFGALALAACLASWLVTWQFGFRLDLEVHPFEFIGAVLSILLVVRTNAGYERWWEGRKLWGGIVNQSRNFAIIALSYGPGDALWRRQIVAWGASFPHVARHSLRGERPGSEVVALVGATAAERIGVADHMPSYVAMTLALLLHEGCQLGMDRFAFLRADQERGLLIDHLGACERILKTPLPQGYAVMIRRFIALFLLTLPFALLHKVESDWLVPLITMAVAYPLLSLDQIGSELQNPFSSHYLHPLPLDDLAAMIEGNLRGLLKSPSISAIVKQTDETATVTDRQG